jgi:hypothetical protein
MSAPDEWEYEDPLTGDDDGDGFGLGAGLLFGGVLAWLLGTDRRAEEIALEQEIEALEAEAADLGQLTADEKNFLSQLWRMEKELGEAIEEKDWERLLVLINVFQGAMNGPWKKFLPGNYEFSPSPKYFSDIENLIGSTFKMGQVASELDPGTKMDPARVDQLQGRNLSVDLDKWEFAFK